MKTTRHITIFILIILLLAGGFRGFSPEDATRDGRIDLSDAVLSAKRFIKVSQDIEIFRQNFGTMVSAMYVAAGLKSIIQANDKPANIPSLSDFVFLVSCVSFLIFSFDFSKISDKNFFYRTRNIKPPVPVPDPEQ